MEDQLNACAECRKPFRGRKDKRFCCDLCRNNFNNKQRQKEQRDADIYSVNNILFKNRMVLKCLLGETRIMKEFIPAQLACRGFVFGFHTHQLETHDGFIFLFCYDYGYCIVSEKTIWISSKKARIFRPQNKNENLFGWFKVTFPHNIHMYYNWISGWFISLLDEKTMTSFIHYNNTQMKKLLTILMAAALVVAVVLIPEKNKKKIIEAEWIKNVEAIWIIHTLFLFWYSSSSRVLFRRKSRKHIRTKERVNPRRCYKIVLKHLKRK